MRRLFCCGAGASVARQRLPHAGISAHTPLRPSRTARKLPNRWIPPASICPRLIECKQRAGRLPLSGAGLGRPAAGRGAGLAPFAASQPVHDRIRVEHADQRVRPQHRPHRLHRRQHHRHPRPARSASAGQAAGAGNGHRHAGQGHVRQGSEQSPKSATKAPARSTSNRWCSTCPTSPRTRARPWSGCSYSLDTVEEPEASGRQPPTMHIAEPVDAAGPR